jgi:hypothetical protein
MNSHSKEWSPQEFKALAHGKPTVVTETEMIPTGDKLIKAATAALWDAWLIGLEKNGQTIYPRLPLLDKEPMEPEI